MICITTAVGEEHQDLRRVNRDHGYAERGMMVAAFLLLWGIASQVITSELFPGPLEAANAVIGILSSETFLSTIAISSVRVVAAILFVVAITSALIFLSMYSDTIDVLTTDVIFVLVYTVPPLLWALLVVIVLGLSWASPIIVVSTVIAPHFMINLREGFTNLDRELIEVGDVFGTDELSIVRETVLPQLYPHIFAGLRSSLSAGWKVIVFAEFFTATNGIGYQVQQAFSIYDSHTIAGWALILVIIILAIDWILDRFDENVLREYREEV